MSFLSSISPFSLPITISAIGLSLIPILIIHFRSYLPSSSSSKSPLVALPSLFYPAVTSHGRHLPITAKNGFSYSVLYLGIDIDSCEKGELNLPFRIFKFGGNPINKLIGLRTKDYLDHGNQGFREKLHKLLVCEQHGIREEEIGKVWLLTLPSLAGWEGPNPLTTWFVYKKMKNEEQVGEMLCVILEVHSSFGESHAYVLKPSSEYRQEPVKGYDLAFKFPRTFHVSPFNSRDGYYRCDLINPFPNPNLSSYIDNPPRFKILLRVLTADEQTKFVATLTSGPTSPVILEPYNIFKILSILSKWPFTLMSVTFRTFYQAWKLHYQKGLALFPRPEHKTNGSSNLFNPPGKDRYNVGTGMQRQSIAWTEIKARKVIERWVRERVNDMGIELEVKMGNGRDDLVITRTDRKDEKIRSNGYANGHANGHANGYANGYANGHAIGHANGHIDTSKLVITTSDPFFFTNLLVAPTPTHSIIMFSEQLTSVSSYQLFMEFFSPPLRLNPTSSPSKDLLTQFSSNRRSAYFTYLYSHSTYAPLPTIPTIYPPPVHFIDTSNTRMRFKERLEVARVIFWFTFNEYIEYWLFHSLKARFVQNSEPWKIWERSLKSYFWDMDPNDVDGRVVEKRLGSYNVG